MEWVAARPTYLEPFDDAGDGLTEADAHRGDAVARVAALQLGEERRGDAGAGGAERMAERDAAAVRVDVARLVALAERRVLQELEDDRRERLVHLYDPHVVPRQARLCERTVTRLRVAVQHQVRVDAREAETEETAARLEAELRRLLLRRDEHRCGAVDDLARVAGCDDPVGDECGLERRHLLQRRLADGLVDGEART